MHFDPYDFVRTGQKLYAHNLVNSAFSVLYHASGVSEASAYDAFRRMTATHRGAEELWEGFCGPIELQGCEGWARTLSSVEAGGAGRAVVVVSGHLFSPCVILPGPTKTGL